MIESCELRISVQKFILILSLFIPLFGFAQVGVNATGAAPVQHAGLDVNFTDKGFLPPRLTTSQRDAMPGNLPAGLTIFNTTTQCTNVFNGTEWDELCGGSGPAIPALDQSAIQALTPLNGMVVYNTTTSCLNMYAATQWVSMCGCLPPAIPSASSSSAITNGSATISWPSATLATGYYLDLSASSSFNSFVGVYNNFQSANNSVGLTDLAINTTYYVRVKAYNSCGATAYGPTLSFTTANILPGALANIVFWLDASQHTGVSNNTLVSSVPNFASSSATSGGASFAASGTSRPTFLSGVAALNNKPAYSFDGGDVLTITPNAYSSGLYTWTAIAVVVPTSYSGGGTIYSTLETGSTQNIRSPYLSLSRNGQGKLEEGGRLDAGHVIVGSVPANLNAANIFTGIRKVTGPDQLSNAQFVVYNSTTMSGSTSSAQVYYNGPARFQIGGQPGIDGPYEWISPYYLNGQIAEFLFFNRELSAAELSNMWYYLKSKYNIQ